jgi:hypothetical protein
MQARRLPAERGVAWLREGFHLFRRNPPLITALTLIYLLVVQILAVIFPGVGPILLPLVLPALTLIVANGCRLVDLREIPGKASLLYGLLGNGPAMLRLGGLQLAGAVLLVLINLVLNDGNDPLGSLEVPVAPNMGGDDGVPEDVPAAEEATMLVAMFRLMLLAMPLIIAFWFAPFLVGWERVSPLKAVFFSAVASWRNWRAMAMFSLAAIVATGVVPGLILIVLGQVSGLSMSVVLVAMRMLLVFLIAPVLTASIYVSYRDIFQPAVDTNA